MNPNGTLFNQHTQTLGCQMWLIGYILGKFTEFPTHETVIKYYILVLLCFSFIFEKVILEVINFSLFKVLHTYTRVHLPLSLGWKY